MKYKIAIGAILFTAVSVVPALADVYVAVDQNGNAVGQAIICDAQTCAKGSLFSQMTLPTGAHYALQGVGIGYGTGAQSNNKVSVDENTNVWTVNQTDTNKDKLTGAITQVNTVQTFTPTNPTRVVVSQSVTPIAPPRVVTPSVTTTDTNSVLNQLLALLQSLIAQLGGR
jgi:hypothetical protein